MIRYVKREREEEDGERVVAERVITRKASARVTRIACEIALRRMESRAERQALLTVVHKANVLALSDGLFRTTALDVASHYDGLEVEEQLVDSMVYRMIREPQRYDVVVAPNLYGDILSDAAAALGGWIGLGSQRQCGRDSMSWQSLCMAARRILRAKALPIQWRRFEQQRC